MTTTQIILLPFLIYFGQAFVCAVIHFINGTKIPDSVKEFLGLIFLPYVIYCLFFNRKVFERE